MRVYTRYAFPVNFWFTVRIIGRIRPCARYCGTALHARYGMDLVKNGVPGRIRTCDPKLRRLVLYPAELRAPVTT